MLRKLDSLRRLTVPSRLLRVLGFLENPSAEITIEYGKICIKKFDETVDFSTVPYMGIIRSFSNLNRIVIPKDFLDTLKISSNNDLNLTVDLEEKVLRISKI